MHGWEIYPKKQKKIITEKRWKAKNKRTYVYKLQTKTTEQQPWTQSSYTNNPWKRKMNPFEYCQTHINWPKHPRIENHPGKNTFQTKIKIKWIPLNNITHQKNWLNYNTYPQIQKELNDTH